MQNINEKKVEKNAKTNLTSSFLEIKKTDKDVFDAIFNENERQENQIELIASENFTSKAVMEAQGSVFTNKYAEGYAGRRYYGGCENADIVERLAISRLKELFGCKFANVQPHSGCSANLAILYALMQPNDTLLGMDLNAGGHLTHGYGKTISGSWMNSVSYGVKDSDGTIDYNEVEELAIKHKPKVIVAGFSAYSRIIDWSKFREIADKVGAILWVDMAHIAGLVAAGAYPSPVPFADVVSSTTHKTLRGPRGAFILSNTPEMAKKINSSIFPGCQGGPLMHVIAAKAIAFKEALAPEFTTYINQVVKNAKALASVLANNNIDIVSGGTDCHMFTADLRKLNINGADACNALELAGMTCNKNAIPNDPLPPSQTSGIRLGAPAATTRGFKEAEFKTIGENIVSVLQALSNYGMESEELKLAIEKCNESNKKLCDGFPLYAIRA